MDARGIFDISKEQPKSATVGVLFHLFFVYIPPTHSPDAMSMVMDLCAPIHGNVYRSAVCVELFKEVMANRDELVKTKTNSTRVRHKCLLNSFSS